MPNNQNAKDTIDYAVKHLYKENTVTPLKQKKEASKYGGFENVYI